MSEFDWISKYLKPIAKAPEALGLQNDVGVIAPASDAVTIASLDSMAEGTHFLAADPIDTVGRKLVRVNVSDILSKGARPHQAMLSVAMPEAFTETQFEALCRGIGYELEDWKISLIGGDTLRTNGPLILSLVLTGRCASSAAPIPRSGASAGDLLYVTGAIGSGYLGLQAALNGGSDEEKSMYWLPEIPSRKWIDVLAEFATASLDISDGLLADAGHLASASGIGIGIDLDRVPWAQSAPDQATMLTLATGGDDYQTLFTVAPDQIDAFSIAIGRLGLEAFKIGMVDQGEGVHLRLSGQTVPLPTVKGYEH